MRTHIKTKHKKIKVHPLLEMNRVHIKHKLYRHPTDSGDMEVAYWIDRQRKLKAGLSPADVYEMIQGCY